MKNAMAVTALLIILTACGERQEVAMKDNSCIDSTKVEMFDEKGRVYYVTLSCDSLANLFQE